MYSQPEDQLKKLQKEQIKASVQEMPGTIMLGLGLYGKFAANGNAFHPLLNEPTNVNLLLVLGAAIMAWGGYKFFKVTREISLLKEQHGI